MLRSERLMEARRHNRIVLILLLLLMFLAAGFGMFMVSRGAHRRQFPRQQHSTRGNESVGVLSVAVVDRQQLRSGLDVQSELMS